MKISAFPCQKGVQNQNFTPDPRIFTKMLGILFRTPLVFSGTGEELLEIHFLAGISTLPTWAPSAKN
jgi:hypothetical protein